LPGLWRPPGRLLRGEASGTKLEKEKAQERVAFAQVLRQDLFRGVLGKWRFPDSLDVEPCLQERICHDMQGVVPVGQLGTLPVEGELVRVLGRLEVVLARMVPGIEERMIH